MSSGQTVRVAVSVSFHQYIQYHSITPYIDEFDLQVTQHEPIWLDLEATVQKTIKIIKEAANTGAKLVAFPECWIPG